MVVHLKKKDSLWLAKKTLFENEWISTISKSSEENSFYVGKKSGGISKIRLKKTLKITQLKSLN